MTNKELKNLRTKQKIYYIVERPYENLPPLLRKGIIKNISFFYGDLFIKGQRDGWDLYTYVKEFVFTNKKAALKKHRQSLKKYKESLERKITAYEKHIESNKISIKRYQKLLDRQF